MTGQGDIIRGFEIQKDSELDGFRREGIMTNGGLSEGGIALSKTGLSRMESSEGMFWIGKDG